jgi:hypothetical protein
MVIKYGLLYQSLTGRGFPGSRSPEIRHFPPESLIGSSFGLFASSLVSLWVLFGTSESEEAKRWNRGAKEVEPGLIRDGIRVWNNKTLPESERVYKPALKAKFN